MAWEAWISGVGLESGVVVGVSGMVDVVSAMGDGSGSFLTSELNQPKDRCSLGAKGGYKGDLLMTRRVWKADLPVRSNIWG